MRQLRGIGGVHADGRCGIVGVGKFHFAELVTKVDRVVAKFTRRFV
jgi:hypothetical protein